MWPRSNMEEERLPAEAPASPEEGPAKSQWQQTKEGWYDKVPLTLKQLDIILVVAWTLLGLTAVAIALEAMGICSFFP